MSAWTHNICRACWIKREGSRVPHTTGPVDDQCCFCGELNPDGIYLREDPQKVPCKGIHET